VILSRTDILEMEICFSLVIFHKNLYYVSLPCNVNLSFELGHLKIFVSLIYNYRVRSLFES
jgi:hypothetical protein